MDEDVSTSYWNTTFSVEETYPNGDDFSVDRVSQVRKVYASNIEKSKYLYFIKVVVSHPEVEVMRHFIYQEGEEVEVNYPLDGPFRVSSDL